MNFQELKRLIKKSLKILVSSGPKVLIVRFFNEYQSRINFKKSRDISVDELLNDRFVNLQPIKSTFIHRDGERLNIVTDSIEPKSLFGGVATSLIFAVLYANNRNMPLRIITRTTAINPDDFITFIKMIDMPMPNRVEYYSDFDRNLPGNHSKLEISEKDIFIATSWWSAHVVKDLNLRKRFFYILQEVETLFYPAGDEQVMCEKILNDSDIDFVVNSKLLYDYYTEKGYVEIIKNGMWFTPAFVKKLYAPDQDTFLEKKKKKMFFYSRPHNPRNLFCTGINLINEAIKRGILKTKEWDIYFAGSDVPKCIFSDGSKPYVLGQMNWYEYSEFTRTIDLAISLMYTPHPSYPPLDIAASGGVVLTNCYENKVNISYSDNIIVSQLDEGSFMHALKNAIELANDIARRKHNYENNTIERSWEKSFEKVIEFANSRIHLDICKK